MRITDIRIEVVRRTLPASVHGLDFCPPGGELSQGVLRILTDEGIEGNCFVGEFWGDARVYFDPILKIIKPGLIGCDPAERERLWHGLRGLAFKRGLTHAMWAPVDVALWDIAGKAAGAPVYKLLGTMRYEAPVYATYSARHKSPDGYVREASDLVSRGFRAVKLHPGAMGAREVIEMVGSVRAAVGDAVELMFDPNCGYGFETAFEVGRTLDDQGFFWYEDPVPYHDLDAIGELSRRLQTPLCMSDHGSVQLYDSAHLIRLQAVRRVRGTALKLGITGLKKLCSLAEGFGMNCEIGIAGNPLLNLANLHVIYSVGNCDYFEYWMPEEMDRFGLVEDIALNAIGVMEAPTRPGLGHELDWDWIASHRVTVLE